MRESVVHRMRELRDFSGVETPVMPFRYGVDLEGGELDAPHFFDPVAHLQ